MRFTSALFLLAVAGAWFFFMLWVLFSLAGVADAPQDRGYAFTYWGGYLAGPVALAVGAALLLRRPSSITGATLTGLGCLALTGFAVYNSVDGMHRSPLQAAPSYWFYGLLLLTMSLTDLVGYKLIGPTLVALFKRN